MDERAELAPALSELAAALHALIPVLLDNGQAPLTPQQIVDIAAKVMPGCQHAAAVMIDQDRPRTLATTDAMPHHVDAIQFDIGEGPSLDILTTTNHIRVDDLADDPRWPQFATRVLQVANIRSMISYRLYLGRHRRGGLNFYSTWPYAFDDTAAAIGAIFAAYCSLDLITQQLGDDIHTAALPQCIAKSASAYAVPPTSAAKDALADRKSYRDGAAPAATF